MSLHFPSSSWRILEDQHTNGFGFRTDLDQLISESIVNFSQKTVFMDRETSNADLCALSVRGIEEDDER